MPDRNRKGGDAGRERRRVGTWPADGGAFSRIWAPSRNRVAIVPEGGGDEHPLAPEGDGYHAGPVPGLGTGDRYRVRLAGNERLYPDPASRFQPDGPHGASELIDPTAFRWTDGEWCGVSLPGQVIYELHVGTFTPEGTYAAAAAKLPYLAELGVTVIEMMPVAEFPGRFGWGYDGVDLFAPTRLYGRPDDLRGFVDRAHAHGIGVILDVVYNHLGPDGNYLACFSPDYFSTRHETEWGEPINFDGPNSGPIRDFYLQNAADWIAEYHFDGLRLDATQSIFDDGEPHILCEIGAAAREAAGGRSVILVAENEPQDTRLVRPCPDGGHGLDALWNDDLHHSAMVALTGRAEAYYEDHEGEPQEFISAAKYGYLFQGQVYAHQGKGRGRPGLDLSPAAFVSFIQNHDQIANSDSGLRFHALANPAQARAVTAYALLIPATPMLFQGQEWWASSPFFYFADHEPDLARLVRRGRVEFMMQFPSVQADAGLRERLPDPGADATFRRSKLDWSELDAHAPAHALHRDLLALRRHDPVLRRQEPRGLDGAVIGREAFALRIFGPDGDDRLLLVNLGRDLVRRSIPEPLLAPPIGTEWTLRWSSEDPGYGGHGTPAIVSEAGWRLPAHATVVLVPNASRPLNCTE